MINQKTEAQIEQLEKEIQERRQAITNLRRTLTHQVEDYTLYGLNHSRVQLSTLFSDKQELVVVHNMGSRCSYCTLWADGFNGIYPHLADRVPFILVSPDLPDKQHDFAKKRGWQFPMYSDQDGLFTTELGFSVEKQGEQWFYPGYSTFSKKHDGIIVRTAWDFFGPGDNYCSLWHIFELLDEGVGEWQPAMKY